MRSRAEALAAVRERLDRTAADQDPRWVLGEQALMDAGELAAASELGGDLDAAYMLGMFYWFRFEASGPQARQEDGTVAALFLICACRESHWPWAGSGRRRAGPMACSGRRGRYQYTPTHSDGHPGPTRASVAVYQVALANTADQRLQVARNTVAVALALLLTGILLTWWAPAAPVSPPAYLQVTQAHDTRCGALQSADGGQLRLLMPGAHHSTVIPLTTITNLAVVTGCD